ncbi:MAG TPA: chorismate mutase [Candidatus Saccharimonadales bacterium]|nr:chorismate mutase [Candidatus Saccharimonadales bacterium]
MATVSPHGHDGPAADSEQPAEAEAAGAAVARRDVDVPEPVNPELRRLRRRMDALDRRIVALLSERAELGRAIGREKTALGRRAVRDSEREREVLLRVTMANVGPIPQADLLAIYRRLIAATRALESTDRRPDRDGAD